MNSESTQTQEAVNSQQPSFQWETPVLYTEEWLKTLGGGITWTVENGFYHT